MLTFFSTTLTGTFASTAAVMVQQLTCLLTAIVIGLTHFAFTSSTVGRTRLQVKVQSLGFLAARIRTVISQNTILFFEEKSPVRMTSTSVEENANGDYMIAYLSMEEEPKCGSSAL